MFQSIEYRCYLGYDDATKLYSYEYGLTDSDFGKVVIAGDCIHHVGHTVAWVGVVIREYSKRKLNVAANLVRYFCLTEKLWGYSIDYSIGHQIELAEKYQPLFTPELKADLNKYLILA
jgi:hypothetical protein